uniref:J domain-containing protein n=1 Tax=Opuntia streptacantha TaxID=393608 RepID=A0A7C9EHR1_OPUST
MAGGGERKSSDFYSVLGLEKECTPTELRNAYKKLAMRWHPDRCSASGNSKSMEEAKKNFQDIQEAYSVLSDETRRFLYDVGVYDKEDDENNNGMGDFLNEMVDIMKESKPNESAEESFEQLQDLFNEMFPKSVHQASMSFSQGSTSTLSRSSSNMGSIGTSFISNSCKRSSSEMNNPEGSSSSSYDAYFQNILPGFSVILFSGFPT